MSRCASDAPPEPIPILGGSYDTVKMWLLMHLKPSVVKRTTFDFLIRRSPVFSPSDTVESVRGYIIELMGDMLDDYLIGIGQTDSPYSFFMGDDDVPYTVKMESDSFTPDEWKCIIFDVLATAVYYGYMDSEIIKEWPQLSTNKLLHWSKY